MNCQTMHAASDHLAWKQRVLRENGNARRFNTQSDYLKYAQSNENPYATYLKTAEPKSNYWTSTLHNDTFVRNMQSQERFSSIEQKARIIPFNRLNHTKQGYHETMQGYMLDSTYTNASDPNSMRDQGAVRNCQYVGSVNKDNTSAGEQAKRRSQKHQSYDRFLIPSANSNKTFYAFGGRKNVRKDKVFYQDDLVTPQLLHNDTTMRRTRENVYPKLRNELVNDYTKNISQCIFSPGVVIEGMAPEHQCNPKTDQKKKNMMQPGSLKKDRAQSAMELTTKADKKHLQRAWLDKLSTAISKENEANRKLRKDIDEIRSNIEKASSMAGK